MPVSYNIFISHFWSYDESYCRLVSLLSKRTDLMFKNYSLPKDDPIKYSINEQAIYTSIYNHIRPSSVILIMAGVYATHSNWINQEIKIAKQGFQSPKPIIAIKPRGQIRISEVVRQNADELVCWNTDSIVTAILKWG